MPLFLILGEFMQLQVWCLSEGGQVIGKTIRDRDWEEHEKNGYVKNPFHLPDSVSRICENIIIPQNKVKLEGAKKQQEAFKKALEHEQEHLPEEQTLETKEALETVTDYIDKLETDIAEREASPYLSPQETQQIGQLGDDIVEIENFLLNLGSERSKKAIWKFLDKKGVKYSKDLTLKPLKAFCRDVFSDS